MFSNLKNNIIDISPIHKSVISIKLMRLVICPKITVIVTGAHYKNSTLNSFYGKTTLDYQKLVPETQTFKLKWEVYFLTPVTINVRVFSLKIFYMH